MQWQPTLSRYLQIAFPWSPTRLFATDACNSRMRQIGEKVRRNFLLFRIVFRKLERYINSSSSIVASTCLFETRYLRALKFFFAYFLRTTFRPFSRISKYSVLVNHSLWKYSTFPLHLKLLCSSCAICYGACSGTVQDHWQISRRGSYRA